MELNDVTLELGPKDELPALVGVAEPAGAVSIPARAIVFVAVPTAGNAACGK